MSKVGLFSRFIVLTLPLVPKFIVGRVAAPYVAGETLDDAIDSIRSLNAEGACATIDLLGEEVTERGKAREAVEEYLRIFAKLRETGVDSFVSVKPTQLGLDVDRDFCRDNLRELLQAADEHDLFVRIDMEDHTTHDLTLGIYRELHPELPTRVGVVFQSYMRRVLADIDELPDDHPNVRICKGIYIEPRDVAWKGYDVVRHNFLAALEKLFHRNVYVGIATHDEYLVCGAVRLIDRLGIPKDRYEFQMLLGVDPQLRRLLLKEGHKLRVYVPYGREWYQYSTRRLRENPEVAKHVLRAMITGNR